MRHFLQCFPYRLLACLAVAAFVFPTVLRGAEGYDPMRVVTLQQVHPALTIVLDRSGSTAFPVKIVPPQGEAWGDDYYSYHGHPYFRWKYYLELPSSSSPSDSFDTTNGNTYSGGYNMVPLFCDNTLFSTYPTGNGLWIKAATWTASGHGSSAIDLPNVAVRYGSCGRHETTYTVWYFLPPSRLTVMKNVLGSDVSYYLPHIDPSGRDSYNKNYYIFCGSSAPVASGEYYWDADSSSMQGSRWYSSGSSYTRTVEPIKLIELSKSFIDWGLIAYSGNRRCGLHTAVSIPPVADDRPSVQDALFTSSIRPALGPYSSGGLYAHGGTPTRDALSAARTALQGALNADSTSCSRNYGAVLLTDGESNCGNPGDTEWGSSCPTTTASCSDCSDYPPGISDTNWTTGISKSGSTINLRTYVVGLSKDVNPCELDHTAYFGRTDAYAADAGFNTGGDPRLPGNPYDYAGVASAPPHSYAFYADNAKQLTFALFRILATMGAGDYTTSPPIVAPSLESSGAPYALLASTEFSNLRGHLYFYDVSQPQSPVFVEDAGATLAAQASSSRKIYTWNPSTNALVEVTTANAVTLDTLAGLPAGTFNNPGHGYDIIDFIRGNDGSGTARSWRLGPILNVTPGVIGPPDGWSGLSTGVPAHNTFETDYQNRHPTVWVGSSDGMLHVFDMLDGAEILALLPPNNLPNQVALYQNYKAGSTEVGEPQSTSDHIYGVANSVRFADIHMGNGAGASYKTVLFLTEGPGGNDTSKNGTTSTAPRSAMYALDVTHPYPGRTVGSDVYPADTNYDSTHPVTPLGYISTDTVTGLHETWSVPAVGPISNDTWVCLMAGGRNPASTASSQVAPTVWALNPKSYNNSTKVMDSHSTSTLSLQTGPAVGDQAFANCTAIAKQDLDYNPAHFLDLGIIADLNGRVWFLSSTTGSAANGINVGAKNPLYYPVAAVAYNKDSTHQYDLFAFGSGSFYEQSSAVTGGSICTSGAFCPTIFIAAGDQNGSTIPVDADHVYQARLTDIVIDSSGTTFSNQAQLVSAPMLFTPENNIGNPFALYLVYDAGSGACAGDSYVVKVEFNPADLGATSISHADVYHASQGVAGGFATAGGSVIVSISGVGQGARATVVKVPNIQVGTATGGKKPIWWIELK